VDYYLFIWSVVTFVEKRLKVDINYCELERATGFSYRHIRETFRECTKTSLAKYILGRRIANAAFEVVHSKRNMTDIANEYCFESYDTFTRAFKRETGITPVDFRKEGYLVGRRRLGSGAYAPAILRDSNKQLVSTEISEVCDNMKNSFKTDKSCILYGVPKVQYSYEECTPFPSCLRACLNYMGQNIDYAYLMAASGAAFRLRWNTRFWDGGNVDIMCIYEDKYEAFKRSFQAAGRKYTILNREGSDKDTFISFIKKEINDGRPVIALGIIGPPEACIITGYDNDGQRLLGWNFFQPNPEFAKDTEIHETGYFICDSWWENPNTTAVMSIGEDMQQLISQKAILSNAIDIMTKPKVSFEARYTDESEEYAGGQEAYDAWAKAVGNDKEFSPNAILPVLFERVMCQGDAQVMVGEGRSYAACFVEWVGKTNETVAEECNMAANYFRTAAQCAFRMNEPKGDFEQTEATARKFAEPEVRKQIVSLILEAKVNEAKARELLKTIVEKL
jgi:AraC-like DNA-binding protein